MRHVREGRESHKKLIIISIGMKYLSILNTIIALAGVNAYVLFTNICLPSDGLTMEYVGKFIDEYFFYVLLLAITLSVLLVYLILRLSLLWVMGARGAYIRLGYLWRMYGFRSSSRLMRAIHFDFEHVYQELCVRIDREKRDLGKKGDPMRIDNQVFLECLKQMEESLQTTLRKVTGVGFNIHIKLIYRIDNAKGFGAKILGNRIETDYEKKLYNIDNAKKRSNYEYYIDLSKNSEEDILLYAKSYKKNKGEHIPIPGSDEMNEYLMKNSSYDYVLGKSNHHWLSNNVKKDIRKGKLVTSCEDCTKFYNSIGVFAINKTDRQNRAIGDSYGLLILDSEKKHVFSKYFSPRLIGYFAHRFYDFFKYSGV